MPCFLLCERFRAQINNGLVRGMPSQWRNAGLIGPKGHRKRNDRFEAWVRQ